MLIFSFYISKDVFTKIPCMNIIYKHKNSADNRNVSTLVGTSKLATQNRAVHKTKFLYGEGTACSASLESNPSRVSQVFDMTFPITGDEGGEL